MWLELPTQAMPALSLRCASLAKWLLPVLLGGWRRLLRQYTARTSAAGRFRRTRQHATARHILLLPPHTPAGVLPANALYTAAPRLYQHHPGHRLVSIQR